MYQNISKKIFSKNIKKELIRLKFWFAFLFSGGGGVRNPGGEWGCGAPGALSLVAARGPSAPQGPRATGGQDLFLNE